MKCLDIWLGNEGFKSLGTLDLPPSVSFKLSEYHYHEVKPTYTIIEEHRQAMLEKYKERNGGQIPKEGTEEFISLNEEYKAYLEHEVEIKKIDMTLADLAKEIEKLPKNTIKGAIYDLLRPFFSSSVSK